jgi:glycosyltransferase involved in cell wall biosynthesis
MATPRRPFIVHLCEGFGGGAAKHVIDQVDGQSAWADCLLVHSTTQIDRTTRVLMAGLAGRAGVELAPLAMAKLPGPWDLLLALRLLLLVAARGRRADIIHCHCIKAGLVGGLVGRLVARQVVYTPHAYFTQRLASTGRRWPRLLGRAVERVIARLVGGTINISHDERRHARALGLGSRLNYRCANGIGPMPRPDPAPPLEAEFGFLGRLTYQKGIDILLAAIPQVDCLRSGSARLAIWGYGEQQALVEAALAGPLAGLPVRFLGPALPTEALARMEVLVLSSRYEGFPYVVLEALAMGVPVVMGAEVGGAHEMVHEDRTGHRFDPVAPAELAAAIDRAWERRLARQPGAARWLAMAAACFSRGRMCAATRRIYRDALARA